MSATVAGRRPGAGLAAVARAARGRRGLRAGGAPAAAAAGGLLLALATPPFDVVPAVFAGPAVLAALVVRAPGPGAAFAYGTVFATAFGVVALRFVPTVLERFAGWGAPAGVAATVALAAAHALAWGGAAAAAHLLCRRARAPVELAFGAGVFAACHAPALFPWSPGALLLARPQLVQLAEVAGERGLTFVVAVLSALLARAALAAAGTPGPAARRARAAAPALAVALAALVLLDRAGAARMDAVAARDGETLRVALLDHGAGARVDPPVAVRDEELGRLHALSRAADARGAELVVWPEGAYPFELERPVTQLPSGFESPLTPDARAPRLIGARTYDGERRRFNSTLLVAPGRPVGRPYDKVELMWLGERMPFGGALPFLGDPRGGALEPGVRPRAMALTRTGRPPVRLGILTCFEDILTGYGRRTARVVEPHLLVGLANNAWFADSAATGWHGRLAAMRAVELRTDFVRAVNRGVTTWVDAAGRTRLRHAPGAPAARLATPRLRPEGAAPTLYVRLGEAPLWAALALLVLGAAANARRRPPRGAGGTPPAPLR